MKGFKIIFYVYIICISLIAFSPKNAGIDIGKGDKTNHILAFIIFSVLYFLGFKEYKFLRIFFIGISFGLFIEFVQYFLPYREFDVKDLVADSIGIFVAILFLKFAKILKIM